VKPLARNFSPESPYEIFKARSRFHKSLVNQVVGAFRCDESNYAPLLLDGCEVARVSGAQNVAGGLILSFDHWTDARSKLDAHTVYAKLTIAGRTGAWRLHSVELDTSPFALPFEFVREG
jgi:hypothetical protein